MNHIPIHKLINEVNKLSYTGIQSNSKMVEAGNVFVAIDGTAVDGHLFIKDAISNGACAVIGEKPLTGASVPYFQVENSREAIGLLAASIYGNPSKKHQVIAITGTNGKTTTSHLIKHILNYVGESCSLIGTVEYEINGQKIKSSHTTPDALQLQKLLFESNDRYVVMEASSHGLDQHRLAGTGVDYALFTNLSHDHLDYHGNMTNYFHAKTQLFGLLNVHGEAIIGNYTSWGKKLTKLLKQQKHVFSVGEMGLDDVQLLSIHGLEVLVKDGPNHLTLSIPLPGLHNIWNTLQAYLLAKRLGIPAEDIVKAIQTFPGVAGRFEQYQNDVKANFIVDYAHSPDSINYCLQTAKELTKGKVVHIFGFRGQRDRKKRLPMLEASVEFSDEVIITLDDLNGESLEGMSRDIYDLIERVGKGKCKVILDRTEAIKYAWDTSEKEDTVLVTGKGPECYQHPFLLPSRSDRETIEYIKMLHLSNKILD
ncbi:UDP-N-acetylmuramoyl-L-alanyl-D-glutamate--2,6-diaminopimelate ligase [Anaerobacillus alkaliphilus]|uniref:UDP-N-acetylmuramyl-tripeptide synthetase n=1 Tax=Anaerobacillus alkaliphilus TaxID=1548597 RepID=A0A4Q0VTA3_9BACI|nr:UDP-N-acetylmuramoyl-L-alanyl-D-glutamate--2,6-diaminopimelate ligase [Anaerobacillus alkaliphilus]RXJ01643.1 UDP-N-acetylmuramoyl-L-alanyl-D-glutamate--2,6-diaminopimelate ligase [Anaerobacillus alkaliphilus]